MRRTAYLAAIILLMASAALAIPNFPLPEFTVPYHFPDISMPQPRPEMYSYVDMAVLAIALVLASWLALWRRSRRELIVLAVFAVLYFGFYRKGCICSIGAVQNVALAISDSRYSLPLVAGVFFLLPLLFALLFGRVFCGAVCPLGAAQEVVLLRPVKVPAWLDGPLSTVPYLYLGAAVLFAGTGSAFVICTYDPFVLFFRFGGTAGMLAFGMAVLLVATVVGRPYCRYLCPYSVLLRLLAPLAKWRVRIGQGECINCHLCADACPYGAIRPPTPASTPGDRARDRRRLVVLLVMLPVMMAVGGLLMRMGSPILARMHPDVRLANRLWLEEHGRVEGKTEATDAFEILGRPPMDAYREAVELRERFDSGSWVLGMWVGLVLGLRMICLSVRRHRSEYQADPASCVACGRCYAYCPVGLVAATQEVTAESAPTLSEEQS